MSVHAKLIKARAKLRGIEVKKSGWNSFSEYKYLELKDFLDPTLTICDELGLCGIVSYTADIASLTITDIEDGTYVVITSPMGSAKLKASHEVQNIGAVETYQRRYLWITAMELVEHDALDSSAGAEPEQVASPVIAKIQAVGTVKALNELFRSLPENEREPLIETFAKRKNELEPA